VPRGGKREGAGRKAGSRNRNTLERMAALEAGGLMPLDYMLKVLRDEAATPAQRMDAAKYAAPYVHARLGTTELKAPQLDQVTEALSALIERAQGEGGGVGALVRKP